MISAPDFEKEMLPHDPSQCMECAIPILKTHRVATSLSIESTDDSITHPRSHTSESIDSNTSSPVLTAKFKVGSIRSDENDTTDAESVDRKLKLRNEDEDKGSVEIHSQLNGTRSRSHSNSPLVRMKRIYNSEGDNHNPQSSTVVGSSEIKETRATTEHAENSGTTGGYSPSTNPEQGCSEEEEAWDEVSEPEDQLSQNQIESPTHVVLNEDNNMVEAESPSSEEITSHGTSSSADRLEVKKDGNDVTSSSNSSTSARGSGGTGTGGDEASSSTQSSETKDVTAEVLINVVPSR